MSPEQAAGEDITVASDWYSVGVMLYEALTGCLPFDGHVLEILIKKQQSEPEPPSELVPELPKDLNELCISLLRRLPQNRPSGPEILRQLGISKVSTGELSQAEPFAKHERPFVGRDTQMAALRGSFLRMKEGHPVVAHVQGRSGMGKTSLVRHFLEKLRRIEQNVVILEGRCYEGESVPYKTIDSLVDCLSLYLKRLPNVEAAGVIPRDIQALARVFPVLRQVRAVAEARFREVEIPDLNELRRRAFAALRELFARLADQKPLVLFIDDLQWGDADSSTLLSDIFHPPDPPVLLLVVCYRSEENITGPLLRTLFPLYEAIGSVVELRKLLVQELIPSEARRLALELLGDEQPVSMAKAEAIIRESGGNPFFIHELVRYLPDRTEPIQEYSDTSSIEINLDRVIQARISQLPLEARRLLEVISVAGQPIEIGVAKQAAGLDIEPSALTMLRAEHLIQTMGIQEQDEIEIYHSRIRENIIKNLTPETLRAHHYGLAIALETSDRFDPEMLALHCHEAGNQDKAARYAAIAADQAFDALAFDRAARLYRLALELHSGDADKAQTMRVRLGDALTNAGRGVGAAEAYLAAAGYARAEEAIEFQRRAAEQLLYSGQINEGIEVIRAILAKMGMKLATTPMRALFSLLIYRAWIRIRGLGFRERDITQISLEELIRIDTFRSIAAGLGVADPFQSAEFSARCTLLALKAGEPYRVAQMLVGEAGYSSFSGGRSSKRTEKLLQTAKTLAERIDHPHALGLVTMFAGIIAFREGRWKKCCEMCEQAEEILRKRCTGVSTELDTLYLFSLRALVFMGELQEISRRLPALLKDANERGDLYGSLGIPGVSSQI